MVRPCWEFEGIRHARIRPNSVRMPMTLPLAFTTGAEVNCSRFSFCAAASMRYVSSSVIRSGLMMSRAVVMTSLSEFSSKNERSNGALNNFY